MGCIAFADKILMQSGCEAETKQKAEEKSFIEANRISNSRFRAKDNLFFG